MQDSVKQRIMAFIEYKGITKSKFETICSLSNGYLNQLRHSPSPDKLSQIASSFPELNTAWLLTGEGDMIRTPAQVTHGDYSPAVSGRGNAVTLPPSGDLSRALDEIAAQRRLTERAQLQIDRLLSIIEHMQASSPPYTEAQKNPAAAGSYSQNEP